MADMRPKRSRILYVEKPTFVGGSVISLYELVRGLDANLYEPVVLFYGPNPYRERFRTLGVQVITLDGREPTVPPSAGPQRDIAASLSRYGDWLADGYRTAKDAYLLVRRDLPLARRLACMMKNEAIDLVHHNNSLCVNRVTVMAAWLAGIPQVCHMRKLCGSLSFERYLARLVDAFIYISRAVGVSYQGLRIQADKGHVVHNPIDVDAFGWAGPAVELRAEFGLSDHDRLVSNIGRLDWWKGQDHFVQAMAEVIQSQPNVRALIVGEPDSTFPSQDHYRRVKQLARDLQLSDHVIFTGFRSDIPRVIASSDVVVHSASEPEPFGRVVAEAMAAGRPVVATAAGGVLDVVEDRMTGLLVPPKNAALMAKAIVHLLQHKEQAEMIGLRAQRYAKEHFSVGKHVAAIQHIYQRIMATRE